MYISKANYIAIYLELYTHNYDIRLVTCNTLQSPAIICKPTVIEYDLVILHGAMLLLMLSVAIRNILI